MTHPPLPESRTLINKSFILSFIHKSTKNEDYLKNEDSPKNEYNAKDEDDPKRKTTQILKKSRKPQKRR